MKALYYSLFFITSILILLTCTKKDDPAILTPENDFITIEGNSGTIGAGGGSLTITDASSVIKGASINVPAGALADNVNISFSHDTETTYPHDESVIIVKFEPEGLEFQVPATITIPYSEELDNPSLYYYQPDSSSLEKIPILLKNTTTQTVTAEILHFSRYFSDEYFGIYADVDLFKTENGAKVKVNVGGSVGGNPAGLEGIKTINLSSGSDNALDLIKGDLLNGIFLDQKLYMTMYIKLYEQGWPFKFKKAETGVAVERIGSSSSGYDLKIYHVKNEEKNEIINPNQDVIEAMFEGSGLVIPLDYELIDGREYFLEVSWVLSNNLKGKQSVFTDTGGATNTRVTMKYVINAEGISSFNNADPDQNNNFTNDVFDISAPEVITTEIDPSEITETTAIIGGYISSDGGSPITKRGVFWGTSDNTEADGANIEIGNGTGSFSTSITDLTSNTPYYYMAYAINEVDTARGDILMFKTNNKSPQVRITAPSPDAVFQKGVEVTIMAEAWDDDGFISNLSIYLDDNLVKEYTTEQSSYSYTWDTSEENIGQQILKVVATDNDEVSTPTSQYIEIKDGNLEITNPLASTVWEMGDQNVEIAWETGDLVGNVVIELHKGSNKLGTLTQSTANDGSYDTYDVQTTLSEGTDYRVKIISVEFPEKYDFSSYFEIKEATNLAPEAPFDPFPSDEAEITASFETLFWSCSDPEGDPLTYDVYFGDSNTPPLKNQEPQTDDTYDVSGLVSGVTYYWYIVAHDTHGNSTQSSLWRFKRTATTDPSGIVSGVVKNAVTDATLDGVEIKAYRNNVLVGSIVTDIYGDYELAIPEGDNYTIIYNKAGFLAVEYNNVDVVANQTTYLAVVLQIDDSYSGAGSFTGTIVDAATGADLNDVYLKLREGVNTTDGTVIETTYTNSFGDYTFSNIMAGNYTVEASLTGYSTSYFGAICLGNQTTQNQNGSLTPNLAGDEVRIVLTWGSSPSDLDSHLTGPNTTGSRFHVYWSNPSTSVNHASLDVDDISSYGPETITITDLRTGVYRYSVHDFSNRGSTSSNELSLSGATIEVYFGTSEVYTLNVPNQNGTLWTVFEINNGVLELVNNMSFESSPSSVTRMAENDAGLINSLPDKN